MNRPNPTSPSATRSPLRIVHVINSFGLGGMEKGIATCVRHGSPGFEHVILCLTRTGAAEELLPAGTRLVEMHKPEGNSIRFIWRLRNELQRLAPAVVHTRNWGGVDGILAARLAGIRVVLHGDHGWDMDDLHGASRRRRFVRRALSGWTAGFTCVSRDIERWLRDDIRVRCPVRQIYNGVDTELFAPPSGDRRLRQELGLAPTIPVVGHVGRLVRVKDHGTLIAAFESIRSRFPDAVLLCVGDGPEAAALERRSGPGVRFLGHRTDIAEVLRSFDVFVCSSLNEGISNTILEAMATAVPVVATDVGGNAELVSEGATGSLVPAGDPPRLAEAIGRYLADRELRVAHGRHARALVENRFSLAAMVRAYESEWLACSEKQSDLARPTTRQ